ncbi:MAG: hypothetical protein GY715_22360 [Planctomycetes bacterium]|nr:hypothetical protein [Planctomycetota bacterium]
MNQTRSRHAGLQALLVAAAITAVSPAAELGYYQQPALHGDRLVFASEGDLWIADIPAGDAAGAPIVAYRITSSDGTESHPRISPDGSLVAFAGEYDGNRDVYVMSIDGAAPRRLTYHPDPDVPLAWAGDGTSVLFRSKRANPLGRTELWQVSARGGMPRRRGFGECSMLSLSPTGRRFAFTRWSNETWHWKGYRGGQAPDILLGDLAAQSFTPITSDPANDLFPMWIAGRIFFLSDRSGSYNLHSDLPQGGDHQQHTSFAPNPQMVSAVQGYDLRWASCAVQRGGRRIVFCQGGSLALYDVVDHEVRRLNVLIATDRVAARRRFAPVAPTMRELTLSADGRTLIVGSRGEVLAVDVASGALRQLTRTSAAREKGMVFLGPDQLALVTDAGGEQQIAVMPTDGSELPSLATEDREAWLFDPAASPNAGWIAFADKTFRLHTLEMTTLERREVTRGTADEITDYRFSPDSQWLAWAQPTANGLSRIWIYAVGTQRSFPVTDGRHDDRQPRWDPAGRYLYFLSDRALDPIVGRRDAEAVFTGSTRIVAVPLAAATPPPLPRTARAAGFDLDAWARPPAPNEETGVVTAFGAGETMVVDTDGLPQRQFELPIEAGTFRRLEAQWGAVTWIAEPLRGLLHRRRGGGEADSSLHRYELARGQSERIAGGVSDYTVGGFGPALATVNGSRITVHAAAAEPITIDLDDATLEMDARAEWSHIFAEAWRLQRDFFWAPNHGGVAWPAMREKYDILLSRIGTRAELNDIIGAMFGELRSSHAYVWGGDAHDRERADAVSVGLLGADIEFDGGGFRIARILPRHSWSDELQSPLAAPHLRVEEGHVILAVNGEPLGRRSNIYAMLQGQAGAVVQLTVADDTTGANRRAIAVTALGDEHLLRYMAWVESNRAAVERASDGALGYIHVPDTHAFGASLFGRQFNAQFDKRGLIVDGRNNAGGFISQMMLARLARTPVAFERSRHSGTRRHPARAPHAHLAMLIDEHAGSDGDVFPATFRQLGLGPLIGTRTLGGVIRIRGGKPFVDHGMSTQPEHAVFNHAGWWLENEGVRPDIAVEITPADRMAGRDPQLDRAIQYVSEQVQADPKDLPEPPPYPGE